MNDIFYKLESFFYFITFNYEMNGLVVHYELFKLCMS